MAAGRGVGRPNFKGSLSCLEPSQRSQKSNVEQAFEILKRLEMVQQSPKDKKELAFVRSMFVTLLRQDQKSFLPSYLMDEMPPSPLIPVHGPTPPPLEVKNWLRASFSQSKTDQEVMIVVNQAVSAFKGLLKLNVDEKGLVLEDLPSEALDHLARRGEWDFDVFALEAALGGDIRLTGVALVTAVFEDWGFFEKFEVKRGKLRRFVEAVVETYQPNPYHCAAHALDVFQTVHYMLRAGLVEYLSDLQRLAVLTAAFVHDTDHDGLSNLYHVRTYSSRALAHNDISPQENHHLVTAFTLLQKPSLNIFSSLDPASYTVLRGIMIRAILYSDMSQHFKLLENLKTLTDEKGTTKAASYDNKDIELICSLALHTADISNPGKPFPLAKHWTRRVMTEFFNQGDKERERKFPISPMCDRTKPAVPDSQCGFIKYVVKPTFVFLAKLVVKLEDTAIHHLDLNLEKWQSLTSEPIESLAEMGVMPYEDSAGSNGAEEGDDTTSTSPGDA